MAGARFNGQEDIGMDVESKLYDSLKTLSKLAISALVAVVGLSVYLIQRSVDVAVDWTDPFSPKPQSEHWGLAFSFMTLSIMWPVVLGALCAAFRVVVMKVTAVLSLLRERSDDLSAELLSALTPLLPPPRLLNRASVRVALCLFPFVALGSFVASQVLAFFKYGRGTAFFFRDPVTLDARVWILLNCGAQLCAVLLGASLMMRFPSAVKHYLGWTSDLPKRKHSGTK
jgi:hypothetical protein